MGIKGKSQIINSCATPSPNSLTNIRKSQTLTCVPEKDTLVTIMGTASKNANVAGTLFGKTRLAILTLLYGHADEVFYLRQIVRMTGAGLGAAQRELKQLTEAGIIRRIEYSRQVDYQANQKCPVFEELKKLLVATSAGAPKHESAETSLAARNAEETVDVGV